MTSKPAQPPKAPADIASGVSVFWLAAAFGLDVSVVRQRIAGCRPLARKTSGFLYALADAAPYLVKPKMDVERYLSQMKPADLPQQLQAAYWGAQLKRMQFETEMKGLWETPDVLEVLSKLFSSIKFSLQMWPDTLEQQAGLSEADREVLVGLCDALQDEIYQKVLAAAKDRTTPNAWVRFCESVGADPDSASLAEPDDELGRYI